MGDGGDVEGDAEGGEDGEREEGGPDTESGVRMEFVGCARLRLRDVTCECPRDRVDSCRDTELDAQATAEAHVDGAKDGDFLGPEVVEDNGGEQGEAEEDGLAADGPAENQGDEGQGDGDDEDGAGAGGAAGEGTGGAVAAIFGEVGEVVEEEAVAVEAEAGGDGEDEVEVDEPAGGEEEAGEGVAGDGEEIGGAEELQPGSPGGCGGVAHVVMGECLVLSA